MDSCGAAALSWRETDLGTEAMTAQSSARARAPAAATEPALLRENVVANPGKIPLELIEVQVGSYLGEDDIVRLNDVYGRG
jgi:hypothetical protein